jgi:hypothetical protein
MKRLLMTAAVCLFLAGVIAFGFGAILAFGVYHEVNLTPGQRVERNQQWKVGGEQEVAAKAKEEQDQKDVNEVIDSVRGNKSREEWKEEQAKSSIEHQKKLYGPHWND